MRAQARMRHVCGPRASQQLAATRDAAARPVRRARPPRAPRTGGPGGGPGARGDTDTPRREPEQQ